MPRLSPPRLRRLDIDRCIIKTKVNILGLVVGVYPEANFESTWQAPESLGVYKNRLKNIRPAKLLRWGVLVGSVRVIFISHLMKVMIDDIWMAGLNKEVRGEWE